MAYDTQTYGQSPFGSPTKTTTSEPTPVAAALSDQSDALSDQMEDGPIEDLAGDKSAADTPELPDGYAPVLKLKPPPVTFHLPRGRLTGLPLVGEAAIWLLSWGTVGFFRSYLPTQLLSVFDRLFTPWGMAVITLASALLIAQLLHRYQTKIGGLRRLATTAIAYGDANHRADAQSEIFNLLTQAEASTERASRWLVSWLTGLGCLFIIGAFY